MTNAWPFISCLWFRVVKVWQITVMSSTRHWVKEQPWGKHIYFDFFFFLKIWFSYGNLMMHFGEFFHSPPLIQNEKFWNWTFWNVGQSSILSFMLLTLFAGLSWLNVWRGNWESIQIPPLPSREFTTLSLLHMGGIWPLSTVFEPEFSLSCNIGNKYNLDLIAYVLMHHARRAVLHS